MHQCRSGGTSTRIRLAVITLTPATAPTAGAVLSEAYHRVTVRHLLDHASGLPKPAPTPGPADGPGWRLKSVTDHPAAAPAPHQPARPDDPTIPSSHAQVYADGQDVTEQSPHPWAEGGMISTAADQDRLITALFRGRLLPPAQQRLVFAVPRVKSAATHTNCFGPTACYSIGGLMRHRLSSGEYVWGKKGSRPGWDNGSFATHDLGHRMVYSLNPTGPAMTSRASRRSSTRLLPIDSRTVRPDRRVATAGPVRGNRRDRNGRTAGLSQDRPRRPTPSDRGELDGSMRR